jgi:hypothetical protein
MEHSHEQLLISQDALARVFKTAAPVATQTLPTARGPREHCLLWSMG